MGRKFIHLNPEQLIEELLVCRSENDLRSACGTIHAGWIEREKWVTKEIRGRLEQVWVQPTGTTTHRGALEIEVDFEGAVADAENS